MVLRRLVRDWRRSVATASIVLLAVTAFVVLTGSAQQARLEVTATVDANFRSSYDILVRPVGSQTAIEGATGRVRPNYLSGLYGGITTAQARTVAGVQGVEVSAPIAMVGQVFQSVDVPVDVTDLVGSNGPVLLRFSTVEESMRGLARTPGPAGYAYIDDGVSLDLDRDDAPVVQRLPGGRSVPVCREQARPADGGSPFAADTRWSAQCWDRVDGSSGTHWPYRQDRFVVRVRMSFPVTVAAIDPVAEARLTGVDDAVVTGRYLTGTDAATNGTNGIQVPVIASSRTLVDQVDRVRVERLGADAVAALRTGLSRDEARRMVTAARPLSARDVRLTAQQGHEAWLAGRTDSVTGGTINIDSFFTPSSVDYARRADGVLTPRPVVNDTSVWARTFYTNVPFAPVPAAASDTGYRRIASANASNRNGDLVPHLVTYGTFDPLKIRSFAALSKLPLETYEPPQVSAADDRTQQALRGHDLAPDANPAGYVQSPPLLLTTIDALPALTSTRAFTWPEDSRTPTAPISAVRVRVAGVTGADAASRERIRLVAERITKATGLAVDITVGSSPRPTPVALPATAHGAPPLTVTESWVQKGVAASITSAVDRKSLALFALVLVTTALAVSISANASVRARRTELGVLTCIGWRPASITRHVLGELLLLGAGAGLAGALLSVPVGRAFDADVPLPRAVLAVPAAVLLTLVAGLVPARRAARATPSDAVRPAVSTSSRLRVRLRGPVSMALGYVLRTPGRALTGAVSLAMGVAALTALVGISVAFQGSVVGTLLGDAVSVQVRGADVVAAVVMTVIGLGCLLDILYLDLREQAPRYASLQASGWRDATLTRLVVAQAAIIGAVGSLAGAALGLGAVALLTDVTGRVLSVAAVVAAGGVLATCVLALAPARRLRTLPTAQLLAQD